MNPIRELKKIALDLESTMQKKAYFFDSDDLKDKKSFYAAVADQLDSTYGEGMLADTPEDAVEKYPELLNVPKKTKAKRDELLAAIKAMPDGVFPLVKSGETDVSLKMPSLWIESQDAWDTMMQRDYSDFESIMGEIIGWIKEIS